MSPPARRRVCNKCVMDTSDPRISFDDTGQCSHCARAHKLLEESRQVRDGTSLDAMFEHVREKNRRRDYDGIIGLSGGLDSAYVLKLAIDHGLRPLVVHVDAGWNSDTSVSNIQALVSSFGLDLRTIVIDWEEMRLVQLAYLRSGLMNQDVPQDHAFFASLYGMAHKFRLSDVITGENLATESILPESWGYGAMDGRQVRAVAKKFSGLKPVDYPILTLPKFYLNNFVKQRLQIFRPLNLIDYTKVEAVKSLSETVDWKSYDGKHGESVFTVFYQSVYLPKRFGIDKRRAHLSSLIVSGQISREEAQVILAKPALSDLEVSNLMTYVARKLEITEPELETMMTLPKRDHSSLPNHDLVLRMAGSRHLSAIMRRFTRGD